MLKKILVIDNYDSFTYNILQIIRENDYRYEMVKNDKITDKIIKEFDKILITPGPGVPKNSGKIMNVIQKYSDKKSILGICLGHQAIAETFGGKLKRLSQIRHGYKIKIKILEKNDYLFRGLPSEIDAGLYNSWVVDKKSLPLCLSITSESTDGLIMGIAHREYDIRGIQFHPESVMTRLGGIIIKNWLDHPL